MHLPHLLAERPPDFVAPHSQIGLICSFVSPRLAVALPRIRGKAIFKTRSKSGRRPFPILRPRIRAFQRAVAWTYRQ